MTTETLSKSASTENRLAARQWVDAFNARDDQGEANARTADYMSRGSPTCTSTCRTPWPMRR